MDANPYLQSLGINTNPQPVNGFLKNFAQGLINPWWYPFMNHIETLARQQDKGPVDPETQRSREAWDALIRARSMKTPSPYVPPNMTGARG